MVEYDALRARRGPPAAVRGRARGRDAHSVAMDAVHLLVAADGQTAGRGRPVRELSGAGVRGHGSPHEGARCQDRKSTRLNSSHEWMSYAVFGLKKKRPAARPGVRVRPSTHTCWYSIPTGAIAWSQRAAAPRWRSIWTAAMAHATQITHRPLERR